MKILVKFPSRSRPERFRKTLDQWIASARDLSRIHWLFSFDTNDHSMRGMGKTIEALGINATVYYGTSTSKIHAVNRDIEKAGDWDVIVVVSDDMEPVHHGWDNAIERDLENDDQLLWYFDGKQRDICTLPVMTRKYFDRTKYIYHPSYRSVFADDEQTLVARRNGCLKFIKDGIATHRHPANFQDVKQDALYRRNETNEIWMEDRRNFKERKRRNFPK